MAWPARDEKIIPAPTSLLRLYRPAPKSRRSQFVSQARAALLWGLVLFPIGQLILFLGLNSSSLARNDQEYEVRLERIHRRSGPIVGNPLTIFALGSSRTQCGMRADYMEKCLAAALRRSVVVINFGSAGAGPVTELFNWRRLLQDHVAADLVLVEIHPAFFNQGAFPARPELNETAWPASRFDWSDLVFVEAHGKGSRPTLRRDWLLGAAVPLYFNRLKLVNHASPKLLPFEFRLLNLDESGQPVQFNQPSAAEQRRRGVRMAREDYHARLQTFNLGGQACEALCELLASLRQAKVPAALLVMPEGPVFRSWYPPSAWPEVRAWLSQLAAEFSVSLLDAREWMDEEDFFDSHHLFGPGGLRFTERLARQEVAPLLQKLSSTKN